MLTSHEIDHAQVLSNYFDCVDGAHVVHIIQDNVIVVTLDKKKYVIKRHPLHFDSQRVSFAGELHNIVNETVGIAPKMLTTLENANHIQVGDYCYDLTEYVENVSVDCGEIQDLESFFFYLGSVVGAIHKASFDFSQSDVLLLDSLLHVDNNTPNHLLELLVEYKKESIDKLWIRIVQVKTAIVNRYATIIGQIGKLPKQIVHGDLYFSNFLFNESREIIGLVDFAHSGIFFRCYEVMRAFIQTNRYLGETDIEISHLVNYLKGYSGTVRLEDIELELMLPLFIYIQASDKSFLDVDSINSGEKSEYAQYRFQSIWTLHKNYHTIQAAIASLKNSDEQEPYAS